MRKSHHNNMSIIQSSGVLIDLIKSHLVPRVEISIAENHHQFSNHIVNFHRGFDLCSQQYFDRQGIVEYFCKLIKLLLLIFLNLLLICYLFIFDSLRLLSFLRRQFLPLFSLFHFQHILLQFTFLVYLYSFHFVFDIMRLDFDDRLKLLATLRFVCRLFFLCFSAWFVVFVGFRFA